MSKLMSMVLPGTRATLNLANALLKGISPADFARMPTGVKANTPAFCYGHLALYPERLLAMVGREDVARPDAKYEEWFASGRECKDDPSRTIYPSMEEIVARFTTRHEFLLGVLPEIDDAVFDRPTPNPRLVDRFPRIGNAASFLLLAHPMLHLGQVSTWRRCMGLGSAT